MQELRLKREASTPWLMQFIFLDPEAGSKWRQRGSQSRHQAAVFPIYHQSCVDRLTKSRRVLGSLVREVFLEAMLKLPWHNKIKVTALRCGCGADARSGGRSPLSRELLGCIGSSCIGFIKYIVCPEVLKNDHLKNNKSRSRVFYTLGTHSILFLF